MGSFGLVLSHSLDASNELVVAARGQTMSIAFHPDHGTVLFGSTRDAAKLDMYAKHQAEKAAAAAAEEEKAGGGKVGSEKQQKRGGKKGKGKG